MNLSRRKVLLAGGLGALAAVMDPLGLVRGEGDAAFAVEPVYTTLDRTLLIDGESGPFKSLKLGDGEPHIVRSDVIDLASPPSKRPLIAFAQMSDMQIVDDQSPMRMEWLDRYHNDGPPHFGSYPTGAAYRAQEMLATQLTDAICRAIRRVGAGPRTRLPLKFTIVTGDMIDNAQYNETRWYIDLLDGGVVRPDSGNIGLDESVSSDHFGALDPHFWHPAFKAFQEARGKLDRFFQAGFPSIPSLNSRARRQFTATGLGMPWYAAYGNHDGLVQGNAPLDTPIFGDDMKELAVGDFKPSAFTEPLPDVLESDGIFDVDNMEFVRSLTNGFAGRDVTADPARRLLSRKQFIAEHFNTTGEPAGHGFAHGSDKAYYEIPAAPGDLFRFICLDSTRTDMVGPRGAIGRTQMDWLTRTLKKYSSHYYEWLQLDPDSYEQTLFHRYQDVEDKLIVIYCHHPLASMTSTTKVPFGEYYLGGPQLKQLLHCFPNVILMVDGHKHSNNIWAHPRPDVYDTPGGFWEVNTASHIDWPIQSRIIEVTEGSGVVSIFTTMLDAHAPLNYDGDIDTPQELAALGRQIAANDIQGVGNHQDKFEHRNTELLLPAPFPMLALAANSDDDFSSMLGMQWYSDSNTAVTRGQGPFTWTFAGLPPGLSWSASGVITGSLTRAGIYPVTHTITDTFGHTVASGFTWTVNVPVPDVRGKKLPEATASINAAGLARGPYNTTRVYESFDGGRVMSQLPAAGTGVQPGITVTVTLGVWNGSHM